MAMRDTGFEMPLVGQRRQLLPSVPLFEVGPPAAETLMRLAPDRLESLIAHGRRHYGDLVLALGDRATWKWLENAGNPYRDEIDGVRRRLGRPGAVLLNMSYEWCCSAGVGADPAGTGNRMLRTLDWPMHGLGRAVVVARQEGAAGPYYNVTWPGYVGVLTAMAPGRFSAAINQPPLRQFTRSCWFDWVLGRLSMWQQNGLPPSHLLRRVFDECRSYQDAKRMLIETPLCLPAFFSLSGGAADEGCVIERLETAAMVHQAPFCITNHWVSLGCSGHDRGNDSIGRRASMQRVLASAGDAFSWLGAPTLNRHTRLVVVANAARCFLSVQGWEKDGPVTSVFTLSGRPTEDAANGMYCGSLSGLYGGSRRSS
jgi:hypothetical protein